MPNNGCNRQETSRDGPPPKRNLSQRATEIKTESEWKQKKEETHTSKKVVYSSRFPNGTTKHFRAVMTCNCIQKINTPSNKQLTTTHGISRTNRETYTTSLTQMKLSMREHMARPQSYCASGSSGGYTTPSCLLISSRTRIWRKLMSGVNSRHSVSPSESALCTASTS